MGSDAPTAYLRSGRAARILFIAIAFLVFAHILGVLSKFLAGHDYAGGLVPLFDLDNERGVGTLFSVCLYLVNASLFLAVWNAGLLSGTRQPIWAFLAFLFCFLAIDESCSIHEMLDEPMRNLLGASGFFYYAWIIPYGIAVGLLSIFVLPTIYRLRHGLRFWFVLSAATFLAGAVGFEVKV